MQAGDFRQLPCKFYAAQYPNGPSVVLCQARTQKKETQIYRQLNESNDVV